MGFTDADRRSAREIIGRYPFAKSALLPLLHLAQDRDGWVTPEAMEEIAALLDLTPALVLGVCSFYSMLKREPVGRMVVSVCTNLSCMVNGGMDLHTQLRAKYAGDPDVDSTIDVTVLLPVVLAGSIAEATVLLSTDSVGQPQGSLATPIVPPISAASLREIDRPSPVPP